MSGPSQTDRARLQSPELTETLRSWPDQAYFTPLPHVAAA
jgi:hypothetical protein